MTSIHHGGTGHDPPDPINDNTCLHSSFHDDPTVQSYNTSESNFNSFDHNHISSHSNNKSQQQNKQKEQQQQRSSEILQQYNTKYLSFDITNKYDISTTGNVHIGNGSAPDLAYAQMIIFMQFLIQEIKENSYKITGKIRANTVPELKTLTSSYNAACRKYIKQLKLEFPDREQLNQEILRQKRLKIRVQQRGFRYHIIYYQ